MAASYPPTAREIIDNEHLRILSIGHFLVGGVRIVISCIPIIHFAIGMVMLLTPQAFGDGRNGPSQAFIGVLFVVLSSCIMVLGWAFGGLTIYSGFCLKKRQHRALSLVVAILNCLSIPFGTALGIFTIIVLSRGTVKKLYEFHGFSGPQPY